MTFALGEEEFRRDHIYDDGDHRLQPISVLPEVLIIDGAQIVQQSVSEGIGKVAGNEAALDCEKIIVSEEIKNTGVPIKRRKKIRC